MEELVRTVFLSFSGCKDSGFPQAFQIILSLFSNFLQNRRFSWPKLAFLKFTDSKHIVSWPISSVKIGAGIPFLYRQCPFSRQSATIRPISRPKAASIHPAAPLLPPLSFLRTGIKPLPVPIHFPTVFRTGIKPKPVPIPSFPQIRTTFRRFPVRPTTFFCE